MDLTSDNVAGASQTVLQALLDANDPAQTAYGSDDYSIRAQAMLADIFEHEVAVFLVATGTAANALALSAMAPPWGAVFCHEESHVMADECGAPEMFTAGAKLVGIPGVAGRFDVEGLREALSRHPRGVLQSVQPAALSLSQVTEAGTLYGISQIAALTAVAKEAGLHCHLDGARFANALVALDVSPAQMTWQAGIDVVSFGATKNGCLACEAVVFFDQALATDFAFRRKRSGHTLSKGRLLGAQMCAYLDQGHWLENARHANAMAAVLAQGLAEIPGVRLVWPCQANEVFAILPERIEQALRAAGFRMAAWTSCSLPPGFEIGPEERFVRFVTAFSTLHDPVARLLDTASSIGRR
jgi:threonine aldolase